MPNRSVSKSSSWRHDASLLFVVAVWGSDFALLRWPLEALGPHWTNALRFSLSALTLGGVYAFSCWRAGRRFFEPLKKHWKAIGLLGLLGYALHQVFFAVGVGHTSAGSAALIMATNPVWTAAIGHAVGYDQLGKQGWAGLTLSLAGTGLVIVVGGAGSTTGSDTAGIDTLFGNGMMLAAAVVWSLYTTLSQRMATRARLPTVTFFGVLLALPVLVGVAAGSELVAPTAAGMPAFTKEGLDVRVWGGVLHSGVLAVGLTFILWNRAIRKVGASTTAAYYNLVPLMALLAGAMLLEEPVRPSQLAGGALIIGGLTVVRYARR